MTPANIDPREMTDIELWDETEELLGTNRTFDQCVDELHQRYVDEERKLSPTTPPFLVSRKDSDRALKRAMARARAGWVERLILARRMAEIAE
jgi:hypothetical protein